MEEFDFSEFDGWQMIDDLGSGGQGDVYLMRSPKQVATRSEQLQVVVESLNTLSRSDLELPKDK